MAVSRRNFLVAGQTLLAAVALPMKFLGAATASSFGSREAANLASSTRESFLPLVNSSFAVHSGSSATAWLTLLSVEDMNPKAPVKASPMALAPKAASTTPATTDTFALHFHGTGEALQQGTYELEHASFGRFSLFVVPSGISTYVAIISHIQSSAPILAPERVNPKARRSAP